MNPTTKLKSAEEWVKGKLIFQVDKTQPDENWIAIVKQIQLNALEAAVEIAGNTPITIDQNMGKLQNVAEWYEKLKQALLTQIEELKT